MPYIKIQCGYCGKLSNVYVFEEGDYKCPVCGDKNVKQLKSVDAFGYDKKEKK